jgi:hypothetical protein
MNVEKGDLVLVYDNIARVGGDVGIVKTWDVDEPDSILVQSKVIDTEYDFWVKKEFIKVLGKYPFKKPLTFFEKVVRFINRRK